VGVLRVVDCVPADARPAETAKEVSGIEVTISIESKIVTTAVPLDPVLGSSLEILNLFGHETRSEKALAEDVDLFRLTFFISIIFDYSSRSERADNYLLILYAPMRQLLPFSKRGTSEIEVLAT